jgi:DNA (cytosine-5)-methyltransferase 1
VFVVGCLGSWESAAKVLFESESLSGDIKKGRSKKQESPTFVESSFGTFRQDSVGGTTKASTARWGTGGNNVPLAQAYCLQGAGATSQNANGSGFKEEQSYTLNVTDVHAVSTNLAVRRLTEVECERLQGFPDNYTNIKENCPSGARYKALGNSMAVPVMKWIGERINLIDKAQEK